MNQVLLYLIIAVHIMLILFVVIVPFFGSNYLLLVHSIIVPFIILHWVANDNTCVLSIMEMKIREKLGGGDVNRSECFTCNLIDPIYKLRANYDDYSKLIYLITISLWVVSAGKLYSRYCDGQIKSFNDFFSY